MRLLLVTVLLCSCNLQRKYEVATYKTDGGDKLYTCTEITSSSITTLKICTDLKDCNDFCQEQREVWKKRLDE